MQISIQNISFRYEDINIFDRYSSEIRDSAVITGPNGSGKTTLLKLIAGTIQPDEGRILYQSRTACTSSMHITDELLFNDISISNHINWLAAYYKKKDEWKETIIDEYQIKPLLNLTPAQLSSGQKQWCSLLLVLSVKADIYLLDEPCRYLDTHHRDLLHHIILRHKNDNFIITSQTCDLDFWTDLCPFRLAL